MSAISTLRGTIATALSDNAAWQVFPFPPATPLANSIVIQPGDPYIEPSNDHYKTVKPKVNFKLRPTTGRTYPRTKIRRYG